MASDEFEFLNRIVHIPGTAWDPAEKETAIGYIRKYYAKSDRIEVAIIAENSKFMWKWTSFPKDWITSDTYAVARTPRTGRSKTRTGETRSPIASPQRSASQHTRTVERIPANGQDEYGFTFDLPATSVHTPTFPGRGSRAMHSITTASTPASHRSEVSSPQTKRGDQVQVTVVPKIAPGTNILNAAVGLLVMLPALVIGYFIANIDSSTQQHTASLATQLPSWRQLGDLQYWSALAFHSPVTLVNIIFFCNVDILFWLVAQIQQSTWLIDPAWTIVPVMIGFFYQYHPAAHYDVLRSTVVNMLLRVWSIRLTHSYFRREEWQFGAREDWRFTELGKQYGKHWWWLSFFATYISQHLMLVGITLPLYAVHSSRQHWGVLDTVATLVALAGMCISFTADNQLRAFMVENQRRKQEGQKVVLLLDTGLWYYSRHPNYFGEQLWWWGLSLYAVGLGQRWMVIGTLFNSLCMIQVTRMTEERMLQRPERAKLYREYQQRTSVWVPWFKKPCTSPSKEE